MRALLATNLISVALCVGCGAGDQAAQEGTPVLAPSAGTVAMAPPVMQPSAAGTSATAMTTVPTNTPPVTQPAMNTMAPAMQPAMNTMAPAMQPAMVPTTPKSKLAMDECGLKTKWKGDEYCIKPPPADKGFQMHIGPSNYENPEPQYVMQPGTEVTDTFSATSGNANDVYYYWRQYRMRPGSHHLIINTGTRRLGGSSNMAKDNPEGGVIAAENKGVGMPLAAHSPISNSLHYFNFTDKPIIKEVWVNFWYRDKSEVTEPTSEVFSMLQMGIGPGQHVYKHGACDITQPGRLLTIYGHVHAHNKRFSVWRTRGSDKKLIHEAYDWEHPNISEFSSTVMNPMLNPTGHMDGGFSGTVDLKAGDVVEFECDIVNNTTTTFVGQNEAENDEMCIMIGDSVGTTLSPFCAPSDVQPSGN